jgi:polysaccharide export outer membrane protein
MEMNYKILLSLVCAGLFFTSCVPTKDLIYLQTKDQSETIAPIAASASKPYRLQVNDIVRISIKTIDPKMSEIFSPSSVQVPSGTDKSEQGLYFDGFTVDDHGNIRMPILGEVNVIGYTLEELRKIIEKKLLEEYFNKEANIFVTAKLAGLRFTINGEIASPGIKTVFQEKLNILEAVAHSGDITITGDRKAVTVMRQTPAGLEMHDIDLTDIKATQSPYFYVQPNDYIYIKPLPQKSWGTGKTGIESLGTIITVLTLVTTTFLLLRK